MSSGYFLQCAGETGSAAPFLFSVEELDDPIWICTMRPDIARPIFIIRCGGTFTLIMCQSYVLYGK